MTIKITVYGIVQGVGFRPFILRLAKELNINGYVKNLGSHVEIMAQAEKQALDDFVRRLDFNSQKDNNVPEVSSCGQCEKRARNLLEGCVILGINTETVEVGEQYDSFSIVESGFTQQTMPVISPDIATCSKCEKELFDKQNRRYLHPFISCVSCGPRFSIIEELPYDRPRVTMGDFYMCDKCVDEYTKMSDRRCHAQTIACKECGPVLKFVCRDDRAASGKSVESDFSHNNYIGDSFVNATNSNIAEDYVIDLKLGFTDELADLDEELYKAILAINEGKIVAIKDIGGYHFACRADMEESVKKLRDLKQREKKPFAVMYPSVEAISKNARINDTEKELLTSEARPIVLLRRTSGEGIVPSVCGDSMDIGAFLSCNPVQIMLMKYCGPLVMTSGNISGEPIIIEDSDMMKLYEKHDELFGVLSHDRRILTPLDDSVLRVIDDKVQFLRRARGYVPLPLLWNASNRSDDKKILALGGDLKAAFCIADSKMAVMSQYFGDLEDYDAYGAWQSAIERVRGLYNVEEFVCACDLHPKYFSTSKAEELCVTGVNVSSIAFADMTADISISKKIIQVQHHHAHIASVLAEHNLKGKILGISFDGTGYGTDGKVWGGEVLLCENAGFERLYHLEYIKLCGGNEAPKNAELVMCCYLKSAGISLDTQLYNMAEAALNNSINTFETSSMGRLFDAVSALLGISSYNEYEGQCAILLEQAAISALESRVAPYKLTMPLEDGVFKVTELISQIYDAVLEGVDKGSVALGFHIAVAEAVEKAAIRAREAHENCNKVALSGGVFANRLLLSMCRTRLEKSGFEVYVNETVPNNDGGIALGQTYVAAVKLNLF